MSHRSDSRLGRCSAAFMDAATGPPELHSIPCLCSQVHDSNVLDQSLGFKSAVDPVLV